MIRHYTETYDLNTIIDNMTLLAIHTPQAGALKKMFKGHFMNFKKYKVLGCDIKMAAASQLPVSPEMVGMESGMIDPRDMMNPILFKACTGENLNALLNQIYNKNQETPESLLAAQSSVGEHLVDQVPSLRAYYQLLADPTFRKVHPMQGLYVRNLKPLVHRVVTTQPFKNSGLLENAPNIFGGTDGAANGFGGVSGIEQQAPIANNGTGNFDGTNVSVFVSSGTEPMPWLDTAMPQNVTAFDSDEPVTKQANWFINYVPRIYMGCIVMPPGVSTKWYMRMTIDWKIAFKDWRPAYEIGNIGELQVLEDDGMVPFGTGATNSTYFNMYHDAETKDRMDKEESSFSANGLAETDMIVTA